VPSGCMAPHAKLAHGAACLAHLNEWCGVAVVIKGLGQPVLRHLRTPRQRRGDCTQVGSVARLGACTPRPPQKPLHQAHHTRQGCCAQGALDALRVRRGRARHNVAWEGCVQGDVRQRPPGHQPARPDKLCKLCADPAPLRPSACAHLFQDGGERR